MGNKIQKVAFEVSIVRNLIVLFRILDAMKEHDLVTVIYGGSHYYSQHKVLENYLGKPIYQAP